MFQSKPRTPTPQIRLPTVYPPHRNIPRSTSCQTSFSHAMTSHMYAQRNYESRAVLSLPTLPVTQTPLNRVISAITTTYQTLPHPEVHQPAVSQTATL